jgi:hypothetical protein
MMNSDNLEITPKELVEAKVCASFAQARRMISGMSEDRIKEIIVERGRTWGRKPRKSNTNIVWPREDHVIETVLFV